MKSRNSGYSSDTEQIKPDLSLLRKPIFTALTGFIEAKRAFDNGTEEIRRLLSKECDIIYECKVCRNIFRSLTNFISHKRVYCRTTSNNITHQFNSNNNRFIDHDISTIIHAEQDYVNNSTTKDNNNKVNDTATKDLSSIIERLVKREQANRLLKLSDFYDQVNSKLTQDEVLREKHTLQLDNVPNSNVAVYQTIIKPENNDNIRNEVNEVHDLLLNNSTVLGPDGKYLQPDGPSESQPLPINQINQSTNDISCNICNLKFTTEKTLKLHIQTKHITSTFVYQCPSCSQTFLQPGAVIRHLSNDHKKSMRRIRLMRESIFKRRIRADEVQVKGPSRELARLQTNSERIEAENRAWIENIERDNNSPMCTYCGKTFERKAVLTTHLNNCSVKNKTLLTQQTAKKSSDHLINTNNSSSTSKNDLQTTKLLNNNNDGGGGRDCEIISDAMNNASIDLTEIENATIKSKRKKTPKCLIRNEELVSDKLNDKIWNLDETPPPPPPTATVTTTPIINSDNSKTKTNSNDSRTTTTPNKSPETIANDIRIEKQSLIITKANHNSKHLSFFCKICKKKFDALSNLRRHISMFHYRKRKFGCKICDYRAFRKYDVINHLNASHSITNERGTILDFIVIKEDSKIGKNEDNIDADVIIVENGTFEKDLNVTTPPLVVGKRRRRMKGTKGLKLVNGIDIRSPQKDKSQQQKFTRSSSNLSVSSNDDTTTITTTTTANIPLKRPIRNRIKPVNKDFVYDLSNLLKKDMILSERETSTTLISAKTVKQRRNTIMLSDENSREDITTSIPFDNTVTINPITNGSTIDENKLKIDNIKGSAMTMARLAVDSFTACFHKPPEIPIERPIIPARIISTFRNDNNTNTNSNDTFFNKFLKSSTLTKELTRSKMLRRVSDDSILRTISKKRKLDQFQIPSSLSSLNKSIDDIDYKKKNISINGDKKLLPPPRSIENGENEKILIKCPTEKEFQEYLIANKLTEPIKKMSIESTPNTSIASTSSASAKRITLMQRLAENKHKKLQESLLKSVLEN